MPRWRITWFGEGGVRGGDGFSKYIAHWLAAEWRATADRLIAALRCWNAAERRVYWYIRWLEGETDAADEDVPAPEVAVRGGFPAAWVNITFDPDRVGADELAGVEREFGLCQCAEAKSRVSYFAEPGRT